MPTGDVWNILAETKGITTFDSKAAGCVSMTIKGVVTTPDNQVFTYEKQNTKRMAKRGGGIM